MLKMKLKWWHIGLIIVFALALISPIASKFPDGLDKTAEDQNFAEKASGGLFTVISDYSFPGIDNEAVATIVAGILGTLLELLIALGIAELLKVKKSNSEA